MPITTRLLATAGLLTFTLLFQIPAQATPERGVTKSQVRSQYGTPAREVAPIGQPPISRWVYDDFTVYFEGEHVIHVVQHQRTLTTPAAQPAATPASAPQPVTEAAPAATPAQETPARQETVQPEAARPEPVAAPEEPVADTAPEPAFRFDPVTGRLIQAGAEPLPAETPDQTEAVEPVTEAVTPQEPPAVEAPEAVTPAPEADSEPQAPDSADTPVEPAVDTSEPAPAVEADIPPAETPAPTDPGNTDTTSDGTRFRFDPVTGKIVIVED